MSTQQVVQLSINDGVAVVSSNSPPVNALSLPVRQGIKQCVDTAVADQQVKAIVLTCEGKTFFAGADIKELGAPPVEPKISDINALLENCPKPVIAAMHGTVLGGGLEVALSCHYRIAVPSTKCGLTEVKLGILPGAGGTQRLPRVVGVEKALEMITSGEQLKSAKSVQIGLFDRLAEEGQLVADAVAYAQQIVEQNLPLLRVQDRPVEATPEVFENFRAKNARKFKGFNAPERCIRCVEAAVNMPFDEGLKFEKIMFAELVKLGQPAALQYAFFAERAVKKIPDVPADITPLNFEKIGVVGAGTMGGGIAMNFANIGLPVVLLETNQEAIDRGLAVIRKNYARSVSRGRITEADMEKRMALLSGSVDYSAVADADLVIEAVFESMEVKKQVFAKLDAATKSSCVLASNTSFLDIEEIGSATNRPSQVIGMHFFSPANVMKLLEVVRSAVTDTTVIGSVMALSAKIGKTAVLVGNCHGFVGNRIVTKRKEQGQALILEGAKPWQVDKVITDLGFPMGPFSMSDLAGLDIGWVESESKGETIRDVLCEMGRKGQKTGAGYYDYDDNRNATPSALVEKLISDFMANKGLVARDITDQEVLERCLYPMINEACKVLEEGFAIRASDIDVVLVAGFGFPRYLGGLCFYADTIGLDKVLAGLQELEKQQGEAMKPSALLEKLVAEGGKLSKYTNI